MIGRWFSEGSFEQFFVLEDLARFPQVQYHYLASYLHHNNKAVQDTIRESIYQPEKLKRAEILQQYLVLFTRLLCEFAPDEVETWVALECFPAKRCLEICKQMNSEGGVYKLTERLGDFKEAILILLRTIDRIDCKRMLD